MGKQSRRFRAAAKAGLKPSPSEEAPPGASLTPPRRTQGPFVWNLAAIRNARDAQMAGKFEAAVRMAEAFRTDDALFVPYQARVSTQTALPLVWRPGETTRAIASIKRAARYISTPAHVRQSILGTMANHGMAIGYVLQTPEPDGSAVRYELSEWPLEHVWYDSFKGTFQTRVQDQPNATINHGDGRWIIFRKYGVSPFTQDAAVLPGALVWAAHAMGVQDWAGASQSHGRPKLLGNLPEGAKIGDGTTPSPDARAFLETIRALMAGEIDAGLVPFGATAAPLINNDSSWQVFERLILNRERSGARIYLGTDAILGATGGAPGVDITTLFQIASTRVQGDLEALERGYREGMIVPWATAHGEPADALWLDYETPDADADRKSEQESSAIGRFGDAVKALKEAQVQVTQDVVDALRTVLGVSVPLLLAAKDDTTPAIELAPTDVAKVVLVKEARLARGLGLLGDERDDMTISELDAYTKAQAAPAPAPVAPQDPNTPPADQPAPDQPAGAPDPAAPAPAEPT